MERLKERCIRHGSMVKQKTLKIEVLWHFADRKLFHLKIHVLFYTMIQTAWKAFRNQSYVILKLGRFHNFAKKLHRAENSEKSQFQQFSIFRNFSMRRLLLKRFFESVDWIALRRFRLNYAREKSLMVTKNLHKQIGPGGVDLAHSNQRNPVYTTAIQLAMAGF